MVFWWNTAALFKIHTGKLKLLAPESLPSHHRDPFDRMLVAQGQVESLPIVTSDPQIRQYGVETIW